VILLPRRARPFFGRHPWVFAGAIARIDGEPADGDEVDLLTHEGVFVARGLFNSQSKIRVRLYSWDPNVHLNRAFFRDRLESALALRQSLLMLDGPGRACRLVFSEADGLSGLIVDHYDRWLVMQFTSLGIARRRELLIELLVELLQPEGVLLRTERGIGAMEGLELRDGPIWGHVPAEPVVITEGSLHFRVDMGAGQKTGFYLDQRDNRLAVAGFAHRRRMLDAFCYTGGFGLQSAHAGAESVLGIDVSEPALALARENAELNGLRNLTFVAGDVFEQMATLRAAHKRFDVIVVDPPKFARARAAVDDALSGYGRLQSLALSMLEADGILVMCCCSGLVSMDMLEGLLAKGSVQAGRPLQILERRGQAPDHPVLATCPESSYLKCVVCRVS
jgi:23S rRNA (cytosine1962-C5)-methyltransferase